MKLIIKLIKKMSETCANQFILIYYNIRGKLQVIRNLLCYLELGFVELHLDLIEAQIEKPSEEILNRVRTQPINRSKLPLLIDGSQYIYGSFAINFYICKKSKRLDLLGKNEHQMIQVKKVLQILSQNQIKCKTLLLDFAGKCISKSQRQIRQLLNLTYENVMNNSHYIRQICQMLQSQDKNGFIFGSLTLVDFYFLETCFYILGFFGSVDKEYNRSYESFYNSVVSPNLKKQSNKMYLEEMRSFVNKMKNLTFYRKYKEYLESFSLIFRQMSEEKVEGIKKIWVGEIKYVL